MPRHPAAILYPEPGNAGRCRPGRREPDGGLPGHRRVPGRHRFSRCGALQYHCGLRTGDKTRPGPEQARALLEQDGYTRGKDGLYEKDGRPLTLTVAYYPARSLDSIALLMQEQLKAVGIGVTFNCQEDRTPPISPTGILTLPCTA